MAQRIIKKWIGADQVDQTKIRLDNNSSLRSRNAADSADVDLIKLNASNEVVITGLKAPSSDSDASTKKYVDDHMNDASDAHDASAISVSAIANMSASDVQAALAELQGDIDGLGATYVNVSGDTMSGTLNMNNNTITNLPTPTANGEPLIKGQLGSANGVAPLNGSSKIDSTYLPSYVDDVLEYANQAGFPVTGETGKIYVALDTNKTYRWSGSAYIEVSPSEVNSVNGATGIVVLDTDDISEGTSNKYFTEQRAKDAAVSDTAYGSGWNGVTDVAPSKNAVYDEMQLAKGRLDALEGVSPQLHKRTLDATDISNQYIDLPYLAVQQNDFHVFADRLALHQGASEDFTLSTVSGVTRITFLNDMISGGNQTLASGDNIYVRYKK